jgi:hypothetical protein
MENSSKKAYFILVLACLLVGSSLFYLYLKFPRNNKNNFRELENSPLVSSVLQAQTETPISSSSPSVTPNAAILPLDVVKTIPLKASSFTKSIVTNDECNNPIGLVTYVHPDTDQYMRIYSKKMPSNEDGRASIQQLESFLGNSSFKPWLDLNTYYLPFHSFCGGYYTFAIKEFNNLTYSGTKPVRAFMVYAGQEAHGKIEVTLFAQKDDEFIQLIGYPDGIDETYKKFEETCPVEQDTDDSCYKKLVINSTELEDASRKELQELTKIFAF